MQVDAVLYLLGVWGWVLVSDSAGLSDFVKREGERGGGKVVLVCDSVGLSRGRERGGVGGGGCQCRWQHAGVDAVLYLFCG